MNLPAIAYRYCWRCGETSTGIRATGVWATRCAVCVRSRMRDRLTTPTMRRAFRELVVAIIGPRPEDPIH